MYIHINWRFILSKVINIQFKISKDDRKSYTLQAFSTINTFKAEGNGVSLGDTLFSIIWRGSFWFLVLRKTEAITGMTMTKFICLV